MVEKSSRRRESWRPARRSWKHQCWEILSAAAKDQAAPVGRAGW
jgi:hypothetical protein